MFVASSSTYEPLIEMSTIKKKKNANEINESAYFLYYTLFPCQGT